MTSETRRREGPISLTAVLSALASDHRRAILRSLHGADANMMAFDALVDAVADCLRDDAARTSHDRRQRVQIALRHSHLPKLEASRMIEYEADTESVRLVSDGVEREILILVETYDDRT
ncbi:DUF7344 domain-containing protein [Haloferacaceae archaeon DSL9]